MLFEKIKAPCETRLRWDFTPVSDSWVIPVTAKCNDRTTLFNDLNLLGLYSQIADQKALRDYCAENFNDLFEFTPRVADVKGNHLVIHFRNWFDLEKSKSAIQGGSSKSKRICRG